MADSTTVKKALPIEWHFPDDVSARFANHLTSQYMDGTFILSFFEPILPVILIDDEQRKEAAEAISSIKVNCVARVAIPASRLPAFIKVLQDNLHNAEEKEAQREGAQVESEVVKAVSPRPVPAAPGSGRRFPTR